MNVILGTMAGLCLALLGGVADAKGPVLEWSLGDKPNSYEVRGGGFEPGALIDVIELSCAELPCASEGLARASNVRVAADGTFVALLQTFADFPRPPGQDYRLLVVTPHGVPWDEQSAAVKVRPLNHPGSPGAPKVGTGIASSATPDRSVERWLGLTAIAASVGAGWGLARSRPGR